MTDTPDLTGRDRDPLAGDGGEAMRFAMQTVVAAAGIMGAPNLLDIGWVHVDACHYVGRVHVDFAQ